MFDTQHPNAALASTIPLEHAARTFDAVIVGSGISGSILAYELTAQGKEVLILEASMGRDLSQDGFDRYLENFYGAPIKDNNSPFPVNHNADMPRGSLLKKLAPGQIDTRPYIVQRGPYVSDSIYTRVLGGTTVHWEAKAIRMLRNDFKLRSNYGVGLDWPIDLDVLMPYYEEAEYLLGVSGDVGAQKSVGVEFDPGYVYPMVELRASYLDQVVANRLRGMQDTIDGQTIPLEWITFPQAKNADPNPSYNPKGRPPFKPVGAISMHQDDEGERCQGNTNCVPLCPVQARFDARKLLIRALQTGRAHLLTQAVASRVVIDPKTRLVDGIEFKRYTKIDSSDFTTHMAKGKVYLLAANAVENARLMLASAILNQQDAHPLMGLHLMDHPYLLCWGQLPVNAGVGRGPSCTSGLCNFRGGDAQGGKFRRNYAAFAADIHNDGWGWATGSPITDLLDLVDYAKLFGRDLREELTRRLSRQLLLAYMIEMPASPDSWVKVDPKYEDQLGNMRPMVQFQIPEYSLRTAEYVRGLSRRIFKQLGAQDCTQYVPDDYGYISYNGQGYAMRGGNHLAGTHVMGCDRGTSVVDEDQKSWDHDNLYLIGPGSLPSIGSSNTTLSTAAICLKTSKAVLPRI